MFNRKLAESVTKIEKDLELIKVRTGHTNITANLIYAEQDIIVEKIDAANNKLNILARDLSNEHENIIEKIDEVNNKLDALTKDLWGMYNIFLEKNQALTSDVERVEQRACELIDLNKNSSDDLRKYAAKEEA